MNPDRVRLIQATRILSLNFCFFQASTDRLLTQLSSEVLLQVFASLLVAQRTIFCASRPEVLTECIHDTLSLLHPLTWQYTLIPILPADLIDCLSAPTPYIIGILTRDLDPHLAELPLEEVRDSLQSFQHRWYDI